MSRFIAASVSESSAVVFQRETDADRPQTERRKMRREEVGKQGEEEELQPPSRLLCGFYSEPGQFWLSMVHSFPPLRLYSVVDQAVLWGITRLSVFQGGFDSGFLYHCKFSENQSEEPCRHQDEPFDFLLVSGADDDPICSMTFRCRQQTHICMCCLND